MGTVLDAGGAPRLATAEPVELSRVPCAGEHIRVGATTLQVVLVIHDEEPGCTEVYGRPVDRHELKRVVFRQPVPFEVAVPHKVSSPAVEITELSEG